MGPNYLYHFIPDGISSMLYLRDPPGPFQLRFLLCFLLLLLLRRAAEVLLCGVDREDIWSTHQIQVLVAFSGFGTLVYAVFLETAQGASSATIGAWYIIHGSVMIIYMAHLFCGWWAQNPRKSCCLIVYISVMIDITPPPQKRKRSRSVNSIPCNPCQALKGRTPQYATPIPFHSVSRGVWMLKYSQVFQDPPLQCPPPPSQQNRQKPQGWTSQTWFKCWHLVQDTLW